MKRTIFDLFAKSPFGPLQDHMRKVTDCVSMIPDLYRAMEEEDENTFQTLAEQIKEAEHDADKIKNEIRGDLPKTMFTPVDRDDLLEVLSLQDSISDYAEDVAVLLSMKTLPFPATISNEFWKFMEQVMVTVSQYATINEEMDELMEASFGGAEVGKVEEMINNLGREEHKTDRLQYELVRKLLSMEDELGTLNVVMWMKVLEATGNMANRAEKVGNRIRLFLSK
ncbi:MAG: TIGR00153 family protein [bacterium]|nr:TIGR00153 family protein [bacterium]MDT8366745.1 TIGR00153 family protein [bacterium]